MKKNIEDEEALEPKNTKTQKKKKLSKKELARLEEERRQRREEQKRIEEEEAKSRKKNIKLMFIITILIFAFAIGAFIYTNQTKEAQTVRKYFGLLKDGKYEEMYELVDTELSKEDFVNRLKNIYEGIKCTDLNCVVTANTKVDTNNLNTQTNNNVSEQAMEDFTYVTYRTDMNTVAGNITINNSVKVVNKNGMHKIKWDSSMIFPGLQNDEKVRITTLKARRGYIYDRNDVILAKNGTCYNVGIVPDKTDTTTDYNKLAKLLGITADTIKSKCNADYIGTNTFVSLKLISKDDQDLKSELLKIKGVMVSEESTRVYPLGESTSMFLGYVQDGEGKTGVEQIYNDVLSGKNGIEIYKEKDGEKVDTIKKVDYENGKDVKLTIDSNTQQKIYDVFKDDRGASVSINYKTGEILALVSFPTFNSNSFSLGFSNDEWNSLQNNEGKPLFNRFSASYVPGSTIKPIIGAVGVSGGYALSSDDFGRSGLKWQPDSSWKKLFITTTETYDGPANLQNALIYSDNIYFAKLGLKIGASNLELGLDKFGFNEDINVGFSLNKSTYGDINSDKLLAQTGYGQGNLMVNPIHMAMMYSIFANNGNMIKPFFQKGNDTSYYKEAVISSELANEIKEDLRLVVEQGTAKECHIDGKNIYGKTGTAEIKENQDDKNGTENGWFVSFDDAGFLITSVIEDVKNRGGSHYVVNKTREIYQNIEY